MIGIQLRRIKKKYPLARPIVAPLLRAYDTLYRQYTSWLLKTVSDEQYVRREFKRKFGYPLPLEAPKTFNEKLHWRKLYEKNPFFTTASDKFQVRNYVNDTIGPDYLIPLIQVLESPNEISFDDLPPSFVIKGTHDSQSAVLVHDKKKWSAQKIRQVARNILARKNYYQHQREWQYKEIQPRCIIESMLKDAYGNIPNDYKIHVFNGQVELIQVADPSHSTNGLYDKNWNRLPFSLFNPQPKNEHTKPQDLQKMIAIAQKLAGDLNYVRVDLFNIEGKIYFGELTFTPHNGDGKFDPPEYDLFYGEKFNLDTRWISTI